MLAEGFDDDGEDGTGEKLLGVIQKMDITNIMVVVCIWNAGVTIGDSRLKGGEFYRMIADRARELLKNIKDDVMENVGGKRDSPSKIAGQGAAASSVMNGGSPSFKTKAAIDSMGYGQTSIDKNDQ